MRNLCRYENRREKMTPEEVRAYWTERALAQQALINL